MKIIYPPLVEQAYGELRAMGLDVTKDRVYRMMINKDLIDQQGQPTKWALDKGYVDNFIGKADGSLEPANLSAFKRMYPVYAEFSDDHFVKASVGWAADKYVIKTLSNRILNNPKSSEEQRSSAYHFLDQIKHWEK
jgi:hypothetical protein